ncbi:MAG TPA: R3H domain-containing nucleic acid-binding protein [Anaerolineaceae bacterium]|jgi:stage III sporulation protein SpoIIIAA|nr:R3H domain-containing nucleic acid-binding protein [Anaerolineaceae bacterium]
MTTTQRITDDLEAMLAVFPPEVAQAVQSRDNFDNLLEVILDLGRNPSARFTSGEVELLDEPVTHDDLKYVTDRIGDFDADNRAGMERTLHRISAIRNRRGKVVGLTCRVGRAVYGTIEIIEDLVESGQSILILGKPGVGKTTMLREAARILAQKHRVVIVDTSNEIGGDGDVPHPAVGQARRMQVPKPSLQHEVMIEAVENHNPEVIVIDEIGRELEALAARTIAERGVQLIGTAHGNGLENLLLNPTLSDLVGGIESVTLSDDEARRRGTQKTVLERRSPPTFTVMVEIIDRERVAVHRDVASSVDAILRGYPMLPEERYRDEYGKVHIVKTTKPNMPTVSQSLRRGNNMETSPFQRNIGKDAAQNKQHAQRYSAMNETRDAQDDMGGNANSVEKRIYPVGVPRSRLIQSVRELGVPAMVVKDLKDADVLVTQRRYYRDRLQPIVDAEERGIPIFVVKSNSIGQIEQFLADSFPGQLTVRRENGSSEAIDQAMQAIEGLGEDQKFVDLQPAPASIRRQQHEIARQAHLVSESFGKDPNRFVRIFRD